MSWYIRTSIMYIFIHIYIYILYHDAVYACVNLYDHIWAHVNCKPCCFVRTLIYTYKTYMCFYFTVYFYMYTSYCVVFERGVAQNGRDSRTHSAIEETWHLLNGDGFTLTGYVTKIPRLRPSWWDVFNLQKAFSQYKRTRLNSNPFWFETGRYLWTFSPWRALCQKADNHMRRIGCGRSSIVDEVLKSQLSTVHLVQVRSLEFSWYSRKPFQKDTSRQMLVFRGVHLLRCKGFGTQIIAVSISFDICMDCHELVLEGIVSTIPAEEMLH